MLPRKRQLDEAYNLGTRYSLTPPSGKVFCAVSLLYANKTSEKTLINDAVRTSLQYDGQFFSDSDKTVYWIAEDGSYYAGDTGKGYNIRMKPGMSGSFRVFIPCDASAMNNISAPFAVELTLPSSEGSRHFVYEIDREKTNNKVVLTDEPVVPYREYSNTYLTKLVQTALNEAGFDCGKPDGVSGNKTVEAIKAFQQSAGLEVTGKLDTTLLEGLGALYYPGTRIIRSAFVSAFDVSAFVTGTEEQIDGGIISQAYFDKKGKYDEYRCAPFGWDIGFEMYMEENFRTTEPSAAEKSALQNLLEKSGYDHVADSTLGHFYKITETGDLVGATYGRYGIEKNIDGVRIKDVSACIVVIIPGQQS